MELTPVAKPVRIHVKIRGYEYNSFSEVKSNFSLKELYPMYEDGRLERWLGQIGEYDILNRVKVLKNRSESLGQEEDDSKRRLRNYLCFMAIFNDKLKEILDDYDESNSIDSIISRIGFNVDLSGFLYSNLVEESIDWHAVVDLEDSDVKDLKVHYCNFFLQKLFDKEWPDLFRKKMTLDDALQLYDTHRLIFDDWGDVFARLIKSDIKNLSSFSEIITLLLKSDRESFVHNLFNGEFNEVSFDTLLSIFRKAKELNIVTNNMVVALAKKSRNIDEIRKALGEFGGFEEGLMWFSIACPNYNCRTLIEDELWKAFKESDKWINYKNTLGYLIATFREWGDRSIIQRDSYKALENRLNGWYDSSCYVEIQTTLLIRDIVSIFEFGNITRLEEIQILPDRFNTLTDSCLLRLRDIMNLKYRYRKKEIDAGYVLSEFEKMGDDFSDLQRFVYNKFTSYWSMASRVIGYILRIKQ